MSASLPDPIPRIQELIATGSVLTLSTAAGGLPWAAPVYYLYMNQRFYFYSASDSRHIVDGLDAPVAGSIHVDGMHITDIRGLQMSGTLEAVGEARTWFHAATAYLRKFPLAKGKVPFHPGAFARIRLYAFVPDVSRYMDNRIRFGYKISVDFDQLSIRH